MSVLWGSLLKPVDASGRESRTLFFVAISIGLIWVAMMACIFKFLTNPAMTITEFASGLGILSGVLTSLIGVWLGRDWLKHKTDTTTPVDPAVAKE